jgi:hypothetical protein
MSKSTSPAAKPAAEIGRKSRRKWLRHQCGTEITCRLTGEGNLDFWVKEVQNISPGGINVVLDRIVPTGKLLMIELHRQDRELQFRRPARVTYLFRDPEGRYVMGAAFAWELTYQDLETFL